MQADRNNVTLLTQGQLTTAHQLIMSTNVQVRWEPEFAPKLINLTATATSSEMGYEH